MVRRVYILFSLAFLIFISCFVFIYSHEVIDFVLRVKKNNHYLLLIVLFELLIFITPIPIIFVIFLNGFLFNNFGFFISMIQIILGSLILFYYSNKFSNYLKIDINKYRMIKKIGFKKIYNNNLSVFLLRFVFPYYVHNLYYGLSGIKMKKFALIIFFSEIPLTYAINKLGASLDSFSLEKIYNLDIINDNNFLIPFSIILLVIVISNFYKLLRK